jgi:phage gp45-like
LTALNTSTDFPLAQVTGAAGEVLQNLQVFMQHGFSSAPPIGSQGVVIPLGGRTDQSVFIACQNGALAVRNLQPGEAVLFNSVTGDKVFMSATGVQIISTRAVNVDAPDLVINGKSFVNHVHSGVQTGESNTGHIV